MYRMLNRIQEIRLRKGLTAEALAQLLNAHRNQVYKLEKGETRLNVTWLERLAKALNVDPKDLLAGPEAAPPSYEPGRRVKTQQVQGAAPFEPVAVKQPTQNGLPVYGVASCHNQYSRQAFELQGEVIDRVKYPPALEKVHGAYALYAMGESMEPRYFEGELVYVHPTRPPTPMSFVVVQLRPEHDGGPVIAMIKRLVKRTHDKVTLEQFNPPERFEIQAESILAIHRILNGEDLF